MSSWTGLQERKGFHNKLLIMSEPAIIQIHIKGDHVYSSSEMQSSSWCLAGAKSL